jgi:WD40 repeat protein
MAGHSSFSKDASYLDLLVTQRKMSRRPILRGLAGFTLTGGSITSFITSCGSPTNPSPLSHTPTSPPRTALYTYRGHSDGVLGVAWSLDGKRIASGGGNFLHPDSSHDTTVQVWDAVDGSHVYTYRGHAGPVFSVAWSPDSKHIASGSNDTTVQVWDAVDGSHVYTYRGHAGPVFSVAWSPDGKRIASGSNDTTVQVWDAVDGSHVYTYRGHADFVNAVAWSPDGKRIASASGNKTISVDKTVQVWDAVDGSHVYTYRGHSDFVNAVAWSPDSKRIASAGDDRTVQVWNALDGSYIYIYRGHSNAVLGLAWSPDGKRIVSGGGDFDGEFSHGGGGDTTVQVWDAADGSHVYIYRGHSDLVWTVAWSPDSKRIASGSADKTVQVWRVE